MHASFDSLSGVIESCCESMRPNDIGQLSHCLAQTVGTGWFRQLLEINLNEIGQFVTHRIRRAKQKEESTSCLALLHLVMVGKGPEDCWEKMERNEIRQFVLTGYFSTAVL